LEHESLNNKERGVFLMNRRISFLADIMITLVLLPGLFGCAGTSSPPIPPSPTPASATATTVGLSLSVSEPADETVVNQQTVRVAGRTEPDAIVSVNGNIVTSIDQDGNFATALSLTEGPNVIELIASEYGGNQVQKTLTVIYVP
jgi:hypothetical protein